MGEQSFARSVSSFVTRRVVGSRVVLFVLKTASTVLTRVRHCGGGVLAGHVHAVLGSS